jgi:hypothetical protein
MGDRSAILPTVESGSFETKTLGWPLVSKLSLNCAFPLGRTFTVNRNPDW